MLKKFIIIAVAAFAVGGVAVAQQMAPPPAQTPGLKRTVLQKFDVPAGDRETVTALIEIPPNMDVARHTHPGPEVDYIIEGEVNLVVEGQPPKTYKAGDSFAIFPFPSTAPSRLPKSSWSRATTARRPS